MKRANTGKPPPRCGYQSEGISALSDVVELRSAVNFRVIETFAETHAAHIIEDDIVPLDTEQSFFYCAREALRRTWPRCRPFSEPLWIRNWSTKARCRGVRAPL